MRYNPGMCGRFTQRFSWRELHELLDLAGPAANLRPRYNVAPGQTVAAVREDGGARRLAMLRWGLIPAWARDARIAYRLINARSETAGEKPSFRAAMRARRCLIPADGFYEWTRRGKIRQPWLIAREDGTPFVFAGLWERWTVPRGAGLTGSLAELRPGEEVETCTILTAAANRALAPLHPRMPVDPGAGLLRSVAARRGGAARPLPGRRHRLPPGEHAGQQARQRRPALHRAGRATLRPGAAGRVWAGISPAAGGCSPGRCRAWRCA